MTMHSPAVRALTVEYADTNAEQLSLTLGRAALPALAERDWRFDDVTLSLRLLSASHQVLVSGGVRFSETVACLPGRPGDLPSALNDRDYRFDSEIDPTSDGELASVVDDLIMRADRAEEQRQPVLVGTFPGHPLAMTALFAQVRDSVIRWETWHLYPQSGQVVTTRSALTLSARRGDA